MPNQNVTTVNETSTDVICYTPGRVSSGGMWKGDRPLEFSLPLFLLQILLIVTITRLLAFILKPLRQPRVIYEILGGLILGPSVLGKSSKFASAVFPLRSLMLLETMGNIGLLYFLFLVGVGMDLSVIRHTGKKAFFIAIGGMVLPFLVGVLSFFILHKKSLTSSMLLLAASLSVTAFPVLARILAELKLQKVEIGQIALSSALINDVFAWVLLAFAIDLAERDFASWSSFCVILSSIIYLVICIFVVRPAISWMIKRTPEGNTFNEYAICVILSGVMISGFVSEAIGTYSAFGAFVFGLVIPNGSLAIALIDRLEDIISGLLLPLFFAISGLKTNISTIGGALSWAVLMTIILFACAGKVAGTLIICHFYEMPLVEAATLGFLMNAKGLVEIVALTVGKEHNVITERSYAIVVISAVIMTGLVTPIVKLIYRPARKTVVSYKWRTIQTTKLDGELRVIACIHSPRNVPAITNLLHASHPAKKSPLCVFALHLVELTVNSSSTLVVQNNRSNQPVISRTQAQSDHIVKAFENFERHTNNVTVQSLTASSSYSTMHEEICSLAEEKRTALIIIPFHKQQTVDGGMEVMNPTFQTLNQNLLANAPCSVGILVDRGLCSSKRFSANQTVHHIAVLFFGGPDDREALSYALRMSEHPGNTITVIRFIPGQDAIRPAREPSLDHPGNPRMPTEQAQYEMEKKLDDACLNEFRMLKAHDKSCVYTEKVVNDVAETVEAVQSVDIHDLFIVGRGERVVSPLTQGLSEWSECPELGAMGDLLSSADFPMEVSVLVVQQHVNNTLD